MNTEVELDTRIDVEFDDTVVWDAVEESVNNAAREAVRDYAWDEVSRDVESMIDDMVSNRTDDMSDVDDHLNDLLQQLSARISHGEPLCGLGTSARDAILAVVSADRAQNPNSPPHSPDERLAAEALDVQRRLADLERQMRVILAEITNLGERAASLTPNTPSVV
jgi:hypothetical protein